MMQERECCGTFEGTPHRNTCRPSMIKEIDRLTSLLAERDEQLAYLKTDTDFLIAERDAEIERLNRASNDVLRERLEQARKEGWEQAKREIDMVLDEHFGSWHRLDSAIASMIYKEAENDQTR